MALIDSRTAGNVVAFPERKPSLAIKNVLFATDFSATSEAALPYAAAISRHFGSTLHAVHVLSDTGLLMMAGGVDYVSLGTLYEDAQTEAKEKLDQLSTRLGHISSYTCVRHGEVWKNLAEVIEGEKIDLIVLGTHGRTGLGKLLLGSVAENILRHACCPVLTVGPKVSGRAKLPALLAHGRDLAPPELEMRQILCATKFGRGASRVVKTAVLLAAEFGCDLSMMHVIEDYNELGSQPSPVEQSGSRLAALMPPDVTLQRAPETLLDFGSASESILSIAAEREADMIVLGARTRTEPGITHFPWSTAHQVLAHATCPVLTIRAEG